VREAGVDSVDQLSKGEQAKLFKAKRLLTESLGGKSVSVGGEVLTGEGFASYLTGAQEKRADKAEFARLKATPKKNRSPSQDRRLSALATSLDVRLPTGGGGGKKAKLSAAESEQASTIESAAKAAGLRAADRARLEGRGGEALAEGAREEKETRERLKAQAGRGEALPGQVDTAFARIAGYNEAGSAPPPPIIVNNYQFKVDVAMPIDGEFSGTPQEFVDDVADKVQDVLELRVFPEASATLRGEINR